MAGRILQADVDEVKARTNIADIIGERVALKTAGVGAMKGLCPFHDERSPSFNVRPQAGFYHCFGCGESGDVYSFLRDDGPRLVHRGGRAPRGPHRLHAALRGRRSGPRDHRAHPPVRGERAPRRSSSARSSRRPRPRPRGASSASAASTPAPPRTSASATPRRGGRIIRDALHTRGLHRRRAERGRARLAGPARRLRPLPRARVWPIRDVTGQVIGFGARRLYDDDNGPEVPQHPRDDRSTSKAQVLYGLDLAKRDISRDHRVVVVEGYTDVMACHLAGITTAIATLRHRVRLRPHHGAAPRHGRRLRGRARWSSPSTRMPPARRPRCAPSPTRSASTRRPTSPSAPEGLDPCDLRLQRGDGAVRALMDTKVPMVEFVIDQRIAGFDLVDASRAGSARCAPRRPIVAELRDPLAAARVRPRARTPPGPGHRGRPSRGRARRAQRRAAATTSRRPSAPPEPARASPSCASRSPRCRGRAEVALERDALMGFLQFGHRLDPDAARAGASALPVPASRPGRRPPGDRGRAGRRAGPAGRRMPSATVREPYRSLAAELLTADFPALTDDAAAVVGDRRPRATARRARARSREGRAARRDPARARRTPRRAERIRLRLRELDAERQRLAADA